MPVDGPGYDGKAHDADQRIIDIEHKDLD